MLCFSIITTSHQKCSLLDNYQHGYRIFAKKNSSFSCPRINRISQITPSQAFNLIYCLSRQNMTPYQKTALRKSVKSKQDLFTALRSAPLSAVVRTNWCNGKTHPLLFLHRDSTLQLYRKTAVNSVIGYRFW